MPSKRTCCCARAVVLFDEIEKAHPNVVLALMGLLDCGEYLDPRGMKGDFRHAVVILTSNVVRETGLEGLSRADLRQLVTRAFAPLGVPTEFLGRVAIVPFQALGLGQVEMLAQSALERMRSELRAQVGVRVEVEPGVAAALCAEAGYAEQGARPILRRVGELADAATLCVALATSGRVTHLCLLAQPDEKGVGWQSLH